MEDKQRAEELLKERYPEQSFLLLEDNQKFTDPAKKFVVVSADHKMIGRGASLVDAVEHLAETKPAEDLLEELGGKICVNSQQEWNGAEKTGEDWYVFVSGESVSGKSKFSFEDALQTLVEARKEDAEKPKVIVEQALDAEDFALLDELVAYGTLLELLERPALDGEKWIEGRLPAILSSVGAKLIEVNARFTDK